MNLLASWLAVNAAGSERADELRGVFAFYYLWYGTPASDGGWAHWDHQVLPHWDSKQRASFAHGQAHTPPDTIHSPFYPELGCYSSSDRAVLHVHMRDMRAAGIDVAVLSWTGRDGGPTSDTQGVRTDLNVEAAMEAALAHGIRIAFHLEPYEGRSVQSLRDDLRYMRERYTGPAAPHAAAVARAGRPPRPVYFVYDSYHIDDVSWASLLTPHGAQTVRGSAYDGFFVGLMLGQEQGFAHLQRGGFDGLYSYFAASGFSDGSDWRRWAEYARRARAMGKVFVPSVGPGYDDTRIRPWNSRWTRHRQQGGYYRRAWAAALDAGVAAVSITSWNEWGEGTQIEPAVPHESNLGVRSLDYRPHGPRFFIDETAKWSGKLKGAGMTVNAGAADTDGDRCQRPKVADADGIADDDSDDAGAAASTCTE